MFQPRASLLLFHFRLLIVFTTKSLREFWMSKSVTDSDKESLIKYARALRRERKLNDGMQLLCGRV